MYKVFHKELLDAFLSVIDITICKSRGNLIIFGTISYRILINDHRILFGVIYMLKRWNCMSTLFSFFLLLLQNEDCSSIYPLHVSYYNIQTSTTNRMTLLCMMGAHYSRDRWVWTNLFHHLFTIQDCLASWLLTMFQPVAIKFYLATVNREIFIVKFSSIISSQKLKQLKFFNGEILAYKSICIGLANFHHPFTGSLP